MILLEPVDLDSRNVIR